MVVTMATPISSHVKDKNSIFTECDEDVIFLVKGKILVFHQYLYNKVNYHNASELTKIKNQRKMLVNRMLAKQLIGKTTKESV